MNVPRLTKLMSYYEMANLLCGTNLDDSISYALDATCTVSFRDTKFSIRRLWHFFGLCRSDLGNKNKNRCNNLVYYKTVPSSHKRKAIPLQAWTGPEGSRR